MLLLLSIPQALSNKAELEVPLWSPVFSLLFYLVFLVLSALHVIVCTSAESSCYFCGLSWLTAGGVMALISALLCAVVSALAKVFADGKHLRKVRLIFPCRTLAIVSYFAVFNLSDAGKPQVCISGRVKEPRRGAHTSEGPACEHPDI